MSKCRALLAIIACGYLTGQCHGDSLLVHTSPAVGVEFVSGINTIDSDHVETLFTSLAGVTPHLPAWSGLTVTSPFKTAHTITVYIVSPSQRPVTLSLKGGWHHYEVDSGAVDLGSIYSYLEESLSNHGAHVDTAVHNLTGVADLAAIAAPSSGTPQSNNRRLVINHVNLHSSAEFDQMLTAISANADLTSARADVVFVLPPGGIGNSPLRSRRAADTPPTAGLDRNLAAPSDPEYAAIFNIILFTSLFLVIIAVAFIMMLAYMDPGLDSVIYRVTNPNKKFN